VVTSQLSNSLARKIVIAFAPFVWLFAFGNAANGQAPPARIAVLDFGGDATSARAAAAIRNLFNDEARAGKEFSVIDEDLANAAARGAGFQGSLNLTVQEARDLGAAVGCEFYFIGDAETLRRSPSTGNPYFESFASIFLVSARTGRLVFWERPLERRDSAQEAEKALLYLLASDDTLHRYKVALRRALEDERAARTSAVEAPAPVIELMSDDDKRGPNQEVRPPRPYRRLKPVYPESAAGAEVEAVVDVLVDIDAHGEVGQIEIARWAGYGLDQSVVDTIKRMHFFPAMRAGVPVPMRVLLRYNFRKPPK
jgi:TonB family protein